MAGDEWELRGRRVSRRWSARDRTEIRDTMSAALRMAGIDRMETSASRRRTELAQDSPLLSGFGLSDRSASERQILEQDAGVFIGRFGRRTSEIGIKRFDLPHGGFLDVYIADNGRVEHVTGTDLVFWNEGSGSLVLVQYKRMFRGKAKKQHARPWLWRARNKEAFNAQLARMRATDAICAGSGSGARFVDTPCFFKFCESEPRLRTTRSMVPGMYLSRRHFEELTGVGTDGCLPRGVRIGYGTVPRYLNNTMFCQLTRDGWIGAEGVDRERVCERVRALMKHGRTTILAVKRPPGTLDT